MALAGTRSATGALARCHGWQVDALDGTVGQVETPLFPDAEPAPDYLVVRLPYDRGWSFAIVPVGRIARVDPEHERLTLDVTRDAIRRYPQRLPIA
ncbi:MAG: hypothetical protein R3C15_20255 [Thermoleophilia bacterium]